MRNSFTPGAGLPLARTPSVRQRAMRRWRVVAGAFLGLAVTGAVLGAMTAPKATEVGTASTGPFSYFPSE